MKAPGIKRGWRVLWAVSGLLALCLRPANAETPQQIIEKYAQAARAEDAGFNGFSAERGRELYFTEGVIRGVGAVSCAGCHLADPTQEIVAHKSKVLCRACHVIHDDEHPHPKQAKKRRIPPLAHSANPERFTDPKVVEDFLRVNCQVVLKRPCSPVEKGDVLTWLIAQ